MAHYRRNSVHRRAHGHPQFWVVYLLSVLFSFHGLLIAYSNSTYLENFISTEAIGALYTISSAIAVFAFLFISRILRRVGNTRLTLILALIKVTALIVLGFATSPAIAIIASVIFLTVDPLIYLNIDIFSESLIGKDESGTGSKRGLTLSLMSLSAVFAPLTLGLIVGDDSSRLNLPYFYSSAIFLIFITLMLYFFWSFKDPKYKELKVLDAMRRFWIKRDVRYVFLAHFILQVFFSWMIIYFPLYLATEIDMSWEAIGSIIAFGLFAYVLFEFPAGIIADRYIGEREMMAVGFAILAIAAGSISHLTTTVIFAWMALMFFSRVGASLVEVTTESYFFKHTKGTDANVMSFFRLTRPLAGLVGALTGSAVLLFIPFQYMFIVLGLMMLPGIYFALQIKDTK